MKKGSLILIVIMFFLSIFIGIASAQPNYVCTIVVDPGHGGVDGGASIGEMKESILTLAISKKIKEVFEKMELLLF